MTLFCSKLLSMTLHIASVLMTADADNGEILLRETRRLMGTAVTIDLYAPDRTRGSEAVAKAFDEAERLQSIMSARDAESELSALNRAETGTPFHASSPLADVMAIALVYARDTDGAFDPSLGACIRLWKRTARNGTLPDDAKRQRALSSSGYVQLEIAGKTITKKTDGVLVDFGGIGKGYVIDCMGDALKASGYHRFRITTSSDILAGDAPPGKAGWPVRLPYRERTPEEPPFMLANAALSTSGAMHQHTVINGICYSHIIDPSTGFGVAANPGFAVTVLAPRAACADALATACYVLQGKAGKILSRFPGSRLIHAGMLDGSSL